MEDHLGNVHAAVDITPGMSDPLVVEQSDYLPFGTRFQSAGMATSLDNRWRYAGKEEQRFGNPGLVSVPPTPPFTMDLSLLDFGARLYDPFTARWTAVDPLANKYPGHSPYNYCGNNPSCFRDSDGRTICIIYKENNELKQFVYTGVETSIPNNSYVKAVISAYEYNKKNWTAAGFEGQSPSTQLVERTDIKAYIYKDELHDDQYQNSEGNAFIRWNPYEGSLFDTGVIQSPASAFAHEADHAVDDLIDARSHSKRRETLCNQFDNEEERRVITGSEQKTAIANGEVSIGQKTRNNHKGKTVYVLGVTSTTVDPVATHYHRTHK